jgi:hypothetical protein
MQQNTQKIVQIDFTSQEDGTHYAGPVGVRRFSIKDKTAIAVRKTQLNGGFHYEENGQGIDESADTINYMIAVVERGVTSAPGWWLGENNYDMGLLSVMFKAVNDFQNTFRTVRPDVQGSPGAGSSSQEGSGTTGNGPDNSGTPATLVGNEVSYSLDV